MFISLLGTALNIFNERVFYEFRFYLAGRGFLASG